jgi:CDP-diacylglycerol--serine O-phosphatidyltransferase
VTDEAGQSARGRLPGGLTLRAMVPNAITAAALCAGLTGIRFAIAGEWEKAVLAVILAGMLDGIDGRIARLLKAQSRFGAELDSLADNVSFGVAPALILYLWSLQDLPRLGWFAALAFAIACALRLARFNARIDMADEPRKEAGFLTGVPAPVGAGLVFLPMYLWFVSGIELLRTPRLAGGDGLPADLQRCNAQLGQAASAPPRAAGDDRLLRPGRRRPADRTVVDTGCDLRCLPGDPAGGRGHVLADQAAARSPSVAAGPGRRCLTGRASTLPPSLITTVSITR